MVTTRSSGRRSLSEVAPANGSEDLKPEPGSAEKAQGADKLQFPLGEPPSLGVEPTVDPFATSSPRIAGIYEWAKTILLIPLVIVRVLLMIAFLIVGYSWAAVIVAGVSDKSRPMPFWRRQALWVTRLCGRGLLLTFGYWWIPVKGKPSPREVAPILVSNHITYVEPIYFFYSLLPSIVSAKQHEEVPIFGTIIKTMQVITVDRASPTSRYEAAAQVRRKAMDNTWPPVLLFPEGTTTNARALVSMKPGAFRPLLPVQPVAVRYRFTHLDPSWADPCSPPPFVLIFRMMTQFMNHMEVEYLPVMEPSLREKRDKDHAAFAERVRYELAKHLNVACTPHTYADCQFAMDVHKKYKHVLPRSVYVGMDQLEREMGLEQKVVREWLEKFCQLGIDRTGAVSKTSFLTKGLNLPDSAITRHVFSLFDRRQQEKITFREFAIALGFISEHPKLEEAMEASFRECDRDGDGRISMRDLEGSLQEAMPEANDSQLASLFEKLDSDKDGFISWDEYRTFMLAHPELLAAFLLL